MKRSLNPLILLSVFSIIWLGWVFNDFINSIVRITNIHNSLIVLNQYEISFQSILKATIFIVSVINILCSKYVGSFFIQMKNIIISFLWFRLRRILLLMFYIILSLVFYCIFLIFIDTLLFHFTCIFYEG